MILITGGSGFVGSALIRNLVQTNKLDVRAAVRKAGCIFPVGVECIEVGSFNESTQWEQALDGVSVVIHAAARVHIMKDAAVDSLAEYRRVNVDGTLHLARQSAAAGVKRFIFISSIKVNGEVTQPGTTFRADDTPSPRDAYGISKWEAEQGLHNIAAATGMEVTIIRPPLVYGPGVKANFNKMMRWLRRGIPLPFAMVNNCRSLVALDNLVNFIVTCIDHPKAANQIFLVSDDNDLSTAQLLRKMAQALGCRLYLFPVPMQLLRLGAVLFGRQNVAQRLCGSLRVDITKGKTLLGWAPPVSVERALQIAADDFLHDLCGSK